MNLENCMLHEGSQDKRLYILYMFYMKCQKQANQRETDLWLDRTKK